MDKQDWIEFFEAINSRTPTEEEIANALASGEFVDEQVEVVSDDNQPEANAIDEQKSDDLSAEKAIVTKAVATPVEERVKETEQNVSAVAVEPAEKVKETGTGAPVKNPISNYFTWLLDTLKHPTTKSDGYEKSFSWITMGLIAFFVAVTMTFILRETYSQVSTGYGFFPSSYASNNPFGLGTFIALFVGFFILVIVIAFSTWVGLKVIGDKTTFAGVVDKYASLYIPVVVLVAGSSVLASIRLTVLGYVLLFLAMFILSVALFYIIFSAKNEREMDDFYAKLLALLVTGLISTVLFTVLFLSLMPSLVQIS